MIRRLVLSLAIVGFAVAGFAQESEDRDKNLDVRSPVGDLHVGKDADAQKAGLPLYPGARPQKDDNNDPLNLGIFTESFGLKLVVAKYRSDDSPEMIISFYRNKMKKYGKVLECHGQDDHSGIHDDDQQSESKPLTCEGDNSGPVRELKVGTEANAHIVAVEADQNGRGSVFTLVYLHKREKQADI